MINILGSNAITSKIRGGVNNLENPKNNQNKISETLGFSLIELSIVLIIIGLLVAGITGGAVLIESAKIRAISNEIREYRTAYFTFYAIKERLPGDLNCDGISGQVDTDSQSSEVYDASSFPSPYDGSNSEYGIPSSITAPFVDLYLEKLISFEPKHVSRSEKEWRITVQEGGLPRSKVIKEYIFMPTYRDINYPNIQSVINDSTHYYNNLISGAYLDFQYSIDNNFLSARVSEKIDQKLDDGLFNSGSIRGHCQKDSNKASDKGHINYEDSYNSENGGCRWLTIYVGL